MEKPKKPKLKSKEELVREEMRRTLSDFQEHLQKLDKKRRSKKSLNSSRDGSKSKSKRRKKQSNRKKKRLDKEKKQISQRKGSKTGLNKKKAEHPNKMIKLKSQAPNKEPKLAAKKPV
jgi:hypothetical protein